MTLSPPSLTKRTHSIVAWSITAGVLIVVVQICGRLLGDLWVSAEDARFAYVQAQSIADRLGTEQRDLEASLADLSPTLTLPLPSVADAEAKREALEATLAEGLLSVSLTPLSPMMSTETVSLHQSTLQASGRVTDLAAAMNAIDTAGWAMTNATLTTDPTDPGGAQLTMTLVILTEAEAAADA